jgi:hypothetical protein
MTLPNKVGFPGLAHLPARPLPLTPSQRSRRASGPHQLVARRRRLQKNHLNFNTVSTSGVMLDNDGLVD